MRAAACNANVFICWLVGCVIRQEGSLWEGGGEGRAAAECMLAAAQGGCQPSAGALAAPLPSNPPPSEELLVTHEVSSQEDDVPPDLTDTLWRMNPKSTAAALQQQAGRGHRCGEAHILPRWRLPLRAFTP